MARPRQPVKVLEFKENKHLTKAEIEERKQCEIHAKNDKISAPAYLTKKQKNEFDEIAAELMELDIFSNLDCDALGRYLIAKENFLKYTRMLKKIPAQLEYLLALEKTTTIQDKAFKQCRVAASDLGLTITSRCRLVIPKKDPEPESKWDRFASGDGE